MMWIHMKYYCLFYLLIAAVSFSFLFDYAVRWLHGEPAQMINDSLARGAKIESAHMIWHIGWLILFFWAGTLRGRAETGRMEAMFRAIMLAVDPVEGEDVIAKILERDSE